MAIACEEYGAKFFANGAAPGGVLEHPGTIKDPQRVRESWQSTFGGSGNANKIAVLEEGMKYTPIGISPEQAQFLETRKFQINEIARIFRVPPHMVGDLEKSSFSNIEQQSLEFVKYTLDPWVIRWEQSIQRALLSQGEKAEYFVKFNLEGLLRGDYQSRMNGYAIGRQNGWKTSTASLPKRAATCILSTAICSRSKMRALLQIPNPTMTERRKMPMKKFWKWKNKMVTNQENPMQTEERTLYLNGTIAEESWFDDDVTPQLFKEELMAGSGNITVWINSPGGDCVAAAQIYNMLMDYPHDVTVKIDGIAASAASVIAMAGTKVLMSPVSMLMIHNPMTVAMGDTAEMQKAIEMLGSVKDSIINAYEIKTGLSRAKLSHLMDAETWMDAGKAVELGFADGIMNRSEAAEDMEPPAVSMLYSKANVVNSLMGKIAEKCKTNRTAPKAEPTGRSVDDLYERLNLLKH